MATPAEPMIASSAGSDVAPRTHVLWVGCGGPLQHDVTAVAFGSAGADEVGAAAKQHGGLIGAGTRGGTARALPERSAATRPGVMTSIAYSADPTCHAPSRPGGDRDTA
jgi:hypothetical protein